MTYQHQTKPADRVPMPNIGMNTVRVILLLFIVLAVARPLALQWLPTPPPPPPKQMVNTPTLPTIPTPEEALPRIAWTMYTTPTIAGTIRLIGFCGLLWLGIELLIALLMILWRNQRHDPEPTILRVRVANPNSTQSRPSPMLNESLYRTLHAVIPDDGSAWVDLHLVRMPNHPAELRVAIGGARKCRATLVEAVKNTIRGVDAQALFDHSSPPPAPSNAATALFVPTKPDSFPFFIPLDAQSDPLPQLIAALQPTAQILQTELHVTIRPIRGMRGWHLTNGWQSNTMRHRVYSDLWYNMLQ